MTTGSNTGSIRYTDSLAGVSPSMLGTGFWAEWPQKPSPETHLRVLAGSDYVWLAIDDAVGQVVGFVTAISDEVLFAYIPLLEVIPDYHGRRIGMGLMRRMLETLGDLYAVDLLCDAHLVPYYERLGMQGVTGACRRNYARQSGAQRPT